MSHNAPAWLNNVVIDGLQGLRAQSLEGGPAADTIEKMLDVWLHAMMAWHVAWEQDKDEPRIKDGFARLFGTVKRWPQPAQLAECMPPRKDIARPALAAPQSHGYPAGVREKIDKLTHRLTRSPGQVTAHDLLAALRNHIGANNGASVEHLARALNCNARHVRSLVTELRLEGEHVCGTPKDGYYMAANDEELEATCEFLRSRAMKSLTLESRMRKVSLPDLVGQMRLPT